MVVPRKSPTCGYKSTYEKDTFFAVFLAAKSLFKILSSCELAVNIKDTVIPSISFVTHNLLAKNRGPIHYSLRYWLTYAMWRMPISSGIN